MPWFWHNEGEPPAPAKQTGTPSTPGAPKARAYASIVSQWLGLDSRADPLLLDAAAAGVAALAAVYSARRMHARFLRRTTNVAGLRPRQLAGEVGGKGTVEIKTNVDLKHTLLPSSPGRSYSILGVCTSVHDPDNFRLYHTPLGRLGLWGTFKTVPTGRTELKDQTLSVRLAGVDAPELAHFGKPAQPYAEEALHLLRDLIEGRRLRVWLIRRDQYGRVVGLAYTRRSAWGWLQGLREEGPLGFWRQDVGLALLQLGAATVYEGKTGAEFGGAARRAAYGRAEQVARAGRRGLWAGAAHKGKNGGGGPSPGWLQGLALRARALVGLGPSADAAAGPAFETPHEYKQRLRQQGQGDKGAGDK